MHHAGTTARGRKAWELEKGKEIHTRTMRGTRRLTYKGKRDIKVQESECAESESESV
jgi:hypothetical protein